MSESIAIFAIYAFFNVATIIAFQRLTIAGATALCFCGGWLFLPVAVYPPEAITSHYFTVDIIGAALPSNLGITKALIVPIAILVGISFKSPAILKKLKSGWLDWVVLAYCLWPIVGVFINSAKFSHAISASAYLTATWGCTWLIGRLVFSDDAARTTLLAAIRWSGVSLIPIALIEGIWSPFIYDFIYGQHAFLLEGADRYIGYRPIGFFEHGNQYGIWMAMSAFAWCLHVRQSIVVPNSSLAWLALTGSATILSQSVGAILLLLVGIASLLVPAPFFRRTALSGLVITGLLATVYLSGIVPVEHIAKNTAFGQKAVEMLRATGRGSLGYRIRRDQMALDMLYRKPVAGYGSWDWWRPMGSHPWGLPLLIAGQFGAVAMILAYLSWLWAPIRSMLRRDATQHGFAIIVLLAVVDSLLNSFIFFPALLASACLAHTTKERPLQSINRRHRADAISPAAIGG